MNVRRSGVWAAVLTALFLTYLFAAPALLSRARASDAATLRPDGVAVSGGYYVLSGSLHDHSSDSDGDTSSKAVASWLYSHRGQLGIDFATLSEHADFLPFAYLAPFGGNVWKKQARIDRAFTRGGFSMLRGFEYTSDQEDHMNVVGSDDYLARRGEHDLTMAALYHWLAPRNTGIAQFNHPSSKGALMWDNLAFDPDIASTVATIEIPGDQNFGPSHTHQSDAGWYWLALTRGWTLGPVMDWDTHHWHHIMRHSDRDVATHCGQLPQYLPCQRTLVIADAATPDAIMRALHARRTTATEYPSLWATLRGPDGAWQGSSVEARDGSEVTLTIEAGSSQLPLTRVEIVSDNGIDPHPYYDGDNSTVIPHDDEGSQVAASYAQEHRLFLKTHGYTLRKGQVDAAPAPATVASVAIDGHHALTTLRVMVPQVPSVRPDHKHFFYAVVYAGNIRAWTAPIFTDDPAHYAQNLRIGHREP